MINYASFYKSTAVFSAFFAGVLLGVGFRSTYSCLFGWYSRDRLKSSSSPSRFQPVQPPPDVPLGIESTIGNTPMFKIKSLSQATGCTIMAKAEFLNGAGGSPKDRVALHMLRVAEEEGVLEPERGDTIYEGTVGSTGISLASLAKTMGYNIHICMPSDQSHEKVELLQCLGAHVEKVTPAPIASSEHYVNLARRRALEHHKLMPETKGFFADQFENLTNFKAHVLSTGPEIWAQTGGILDAFVAGAGTGGTISGVSHYLKDKMSMGNKLKVVLADPEGSGLHNKILYGVMYSNTEKEGTRRRDQVDSVVEGIGINRLTQNFDVGQRLIDDSIKVTDLQAINMAKWLMENDGIFVGSSSAVNCVAAVATALKLPRDSRIVTVLCDSGTRHLSKFWKIVGGLDWSTEPTRPTDLLKLLDFKDNR
ncbi:Bgt-1905 [Blumeria graminis f. sp. tritici]|uniref:Cysteine synthase 2 n=2 Tax=Blumeria graminis f. sp. tritici TaxID=62690 RepID=A0A061HS75_BLUGR|nr:cysteine synthase [Blumeria graminis f. sp. tritici 96224]VCU40246.1 Bgt-1905 [Blumeria graminis f. sp. tritici]